MPNRRCAQCLVWQGRAGVPVFEGVANKLPDEVFKIDLTAEQLLERSRSVKDMGFQGICYFVSESLSDEDLKMIKLL